DLFRARLSRALSRLPAGRRRGPDRARRRRVHPHGVRPQARRSAGAAARRRLRRSARAQRAFATWRARFGAGRARPHPGDRPCARLRRGRGAGGVVEGRALLSFLPALAPTVLGSDLALPNVATWWLGQARARDEIIDRLDEMVIASAFLGELPGHGERREVLGAMLEPDERT